MSNIDPSQEGDPQISIQDYRAAMEAKAALERERVELQNQILSKDVEYAAATAGIPTGTGAGKAFIASYDGPRDPESMRAAALEFGIWKPEGSDATAATPAAQAQVDADRAALQAAGGVVDPNEQPPAKMPGEEGLEAFHAALASGRSRPNASAEVINRITTAAIRGDDRVLVHPWTDEDYAG